MLQGPVIGGLVCSKVPEVVAENSDVASKYNESCECQAGEMAKILNVRKVGDTHRNSRHSSQKLRRLSRRGRRSSCSAVINQTGHLGGGIGESTY